MNSDAQMTSVAIHEMTMRFAKGLIDGPCPLFARSDSFDRAGAAHLRFPDGGYELPGVCLTAIAH
jgi:hypothetical protein